jgi:hypothetical protein
MQTISYNSATVGYGSSQQTLPGGSVNIYDSEVEAKKVAASAGGIARLKKEFADGSNFLRIAGLRPDVQKKAAATVQGPHNKDVANYVKQSLMFISAAIKFQETENEKQRVEAAELATDQQLATDQYNADTGTPGTAAYYYRQLMHLDDKPLTPAGLGLVNTALDALEQMKDGNARAAIIQEIRAIHQQRRG